MQSPVRTPDHPRVRASLTCPLCLRHKDTGLVACWPCFGRYDMRQGNWTLESIFDEAESALEAGALQLRSITGDWSMCPCGSRQAPGHQCWP